MGCKVKIGLGDLRWIREKCGAAAWGVLSDGEANGSYRYLYDVETIANWKWK